MLPIQRQGQDFTERMVSDGAGVLSHLYGMEPHMTATFVSLRFTPVSASCPRHSCVLLQHRCFPFELAPNFLASETGGVGTCPRWQNSLRQRSPSAVLRTSVLRFYGIVQHGFVRLPTILVIFSSKRTAGDHLRASFFVLWAVNDHWFGNKMCCLRGSHRNYFCGNY